MGNLNILIVEGNIREDSEFFIKAAGASAADNLKNLILMKLVNYQKMLLSYQVIKLIM